MPTSNISNQGVTDNRCSFYLVITLKAFDNKMMRMMKMNTNTHQGRMYREIGGFKSVYLNAGEQIEILIPNKGVIKIDSDGVANIDKGNQGHAINIFESADNKLINKEKVVEYLNLLFEAQRAGHDVHQEINSALAMYKIYVGL